MEAQPTILGAGAPFTLQFEGQTCFVFEDVDEVGEMDMASFSLTTHVARYVKIGGPGYGFGGFQLAELEVYGPSSGSPCDLNNSGGRDAVDNGTSDPKFNVDGVGSDVPDQADFSFYITDPSMLSTGFGDFDFNKIVNFNDFVNLPNDFGVTGTGWARGNFNTDDITNFNDFVAVSNNFGMNFASNVPEPAAIGALGVLVMLLLRKRHQCGP